MLRTFFEAKRLRPYKTCALMLDIVGREVRVNATNENLPVEFAHGDEVLIRADGPSINTTKACI